MVIPSDTRCDFFIQWIIHFSQMTFNILSRLASLGIKLHLIKHQKYSMKYFPNQSFFYYIVTWRLKIPVVTMNEEFCHKVWKSLSFLRRDRTLIYTISIHKVRKQNLLPYSEKMEETIYNYNAWICYCLWTWNHFLSIIVKITHTKRILNFQLIWWVLITDNWYP